MKGSWRVFKSKGTSEWEPKRRGSAIASAASADRMVSWPDGSSSAAAVSSID
jgi:hypothetical protein